MGALAPAAGVGVKNKGAVEDRFDDVAQRMVHHPVAVRGGADQTPFGIVNPEVTISAVTVCLGMQLPLQPQQLTFKVEIEAGGGPFESFTPLRLAGGQEQVLESDDLRVEVSVLFAWLLYLSHPPMDLPMVLTAAAENS